MVKGHEQADGQGLLSGGQIIPISYCRCLVQARLTLAIPPSLASHTTYSTPEPEPKPEPEASASGI